MRIHRSIALMLSLMVSAAYCAAVERRPNADTPGPEKPRVGRSLQEADKNGDGKVVYDELKAVRPQLTPERFKEMDHNGDGVLGREDRPQNQGDGERPRQEQGQGKGGNRVQDSLKRADANHDGKVSFDELRAVAPKMTQDRFSMLDRNHDGFITADDKPRGAEAGNRAEMFKQADANHDGKVTLEELKTVRPNLTKERFDLMDSNHDGVLSPDDKPHQGKPGGGPDRAGASGAQADEIKKLMEVDANRDGTVSFTELSGAKPGFPKETFGRYDANGDGVLSADDIKARR